MNPIRKRERGYTLITLVFIFAILGFFVLLIMKIGPIYIDHSKVTNSLAALKQMEGIESYSRREVLNALDKRFNLNYVDFIDKSEIKVIKHGDYLKVQIEYEVIKNIMGNLSVLVEFDDSIEVGKT
ncbi:MAG: DUF4845 domain-containing protein [Gammaproteobacteria bacterium]